MTTRTAPNWKGTYSKNDETRVESNHRCILPGSDDDLALTLNGSSQEAFVSQRENGLIDRGYYALARLDGVGFLLVSGQERKESRIGR